eukprot:2664416-Rhodomonas_salina.4
MEALERSLSEMTNVLSREEEVPEDVRKSMWEHVEHLLERVDVIEEALSRQGKVRDDARARHASAIQEGKQLQDQIIVLKVRASAHGSPGEARLDEGSLIQGSRRKSEVDGSETDTAEALARLKGLALAETLRKTEAAQHVVAAVGAQAGGMWMDHASCGKAVLEEDVIKRRF